MMPSDTCWTDDSLGALREEFAAVYGGRTVLVTGADGFMGSHLTEALVALDANVHAFVRATSSGALNNIGQFRNRLKVHFADLTDKTSIDYLMRELKETATDKPYIFHLGAQAHVGESWHRPYETVMANTIGTLNLLQSIVDYGLEIEKFDTAGTSEEYGNVNEDVSHHHDFDKEGSLILHERSPVNPKSIYATSKVAADFLTMNYFDGYGLPGVVTRMFNNYGPRQNPRYITGTIITQALERDVIELGALTPLRDFCFCSDGVRGHLTVASKGKSGDVYVYGQGDNISMADWAALILRIGEEQGYWGKREITSVAKRFRPGSSDVVALRVGYEKLHAETGWKPLVSWEEGVAQCIDEIVNVLEPHRQPHEAVRQTDPLAFSRFYSRVGHGHGVSNQGFDGAQVLGERPEPNAVHQRLAGSHSAHDLEGQHGSIARRLSCGQVVLGKGRESRIVHGRDFRLRLQKLGNGQRIGGLAVHAHR